MTERPTSENQEAVSRHALRRQSAYAGPKCSMDATPSDEYLVEQIGRRDESALAAAIDAYAPQVRAISLRICSDSLDAESVVSVVFWSLWTSPHKFDHGRGSLRSYLMTLARSRAIDRQRAAIARQRNSQKFIDSNHPSSTNGVVIHNVCQEHVAQEQAIELRNAIVQLPTSQRTALEMAFFDGMTHQEVALKQSLPLGTIKTNIRRGLIRLHEIMLESTREQKLV